MRKSLSTFLFVLAIFLIFLAAFSAALRWTPLTRMAFLRPLLIAAGLLFFGQWAARLVGQSPLARRLGSQPLFRRVKQMVQAVSRLVRHICFSPRIGLAFACVVFVLMAVFSIWYASLGLFPEFPKIGNLYVNQANAFLKGHLSLLESPSPQILALSDPYTFEARKGLTYLWDASLYHGKYYLYWGPVPALILAAVKALTGGPIPDPFLAAASAIGILAILWTLLWQVRKRFFSQSPAISISLFLLVAILNLPFLFLLGRGRVYETAIITGQFFLLVGLTAFFMATQSRKSGWLLLAGLSWGFAIACRYNLAISVAVFTGFALWIIYRSMGEHRAVGTRMVCLVGPLVVCLLGLGAYNALRFGNPFETGLNYQLTAPVDQGRHFSLAYLRTDIYLNLLYPYRRVESFPLIRSIGVAPQKAPAWVNFNPGVRFDETIFSMRIVPLFWLLALLLPLSGVCWWIDRRRGRGSPRLAPDGLLPWGVMIGLAGLLQFGALMLYYYVAVRFMADYYLLWLLAAVLLLWSLDRRLIHNPWLRTGLWCLVALAIIATVILGFLAGFDNPPRVFEIYNHALETRIASVWDAIYTSSRIPGKILRYFMAFIL